MGTRRNEVERSRMMAEDLVGMARQVIDTCDEGLIEVAVGRLNDLLIEHKSGITAEQIDEAAWHAAVRDAASGNIRISSARECAGKSNTTQRGR